MMWQRGLPKLDINQRLPPTHRRKYEIHCELDFASGDVSRRQREIHEDRWNAAGGRGTDWTLARNERNRICGCGDRRSESSVRVVCGMARIFADPDDSVP